MYELTYSLRTLYARVCNVSQVLFNSRLRRDYNYISLNSGPLVAIVMQSHLYAGGTHGHLLGLAEYILYRVHAIG